MTTQEVKQKLNGAFHTLSSRNGIFTAKMSYYWGITKSADWYADKIKDLIPEAEIVDSGNHWHAFVGGAKSGSAKDSYFWVKFRVN